MQDVVVALIGSGITIVVGAAGGAVAWAAKRRSERAERIAAAVAADQEQTELDAATTQTAADQWRALALDYPAQVAATEARRKTDAELREIRAHQATQDATLADLRARIDRMQTNQQRAIRDTHPLAEHAESTGHAHPVTPWLRAWLHPTD